MERKMRNGSRWLGVSTFIQDPLSRSILIVVEV